VLWHLLHYGDGVVVKYCWHIFRRKLVCCVADQEAGLPNSTVAHDDTPVNVSASLCISNTNVKPSPDVLDGGSNHIGQNVTGGSDSQDFGGGVLQLDRDKAGCREEERQDVDVVGRMLLVDCGTAGSLD
jgi:hypothetical protein